MQLQRPAPFDEEVAQMRRVKVLAMAARSAEHLNHDIVMDEIGNGAKPDR